MTFRCFVIRCLLASAWLSPHALAETAQDHKAQLEALKNRAQSLQRQLNQDRGEQDSVQTDLERIETDIAQINRQIRETQDALRSGQQRLARLEGEAALQEAQLTEQRQGLEQLVYATFLMGHQEYLKLLLNQEDPARLGRTMTYYRYLARARTEQIDALRRILDRIRDLGIEISTQQRELRDLETTQLEHRQALNERQAERVVYLTEVKRRISSREDELRQVRRDEQRLTRLLEDLRSYLADLPADVGERKAFGQMRGRLRLPVEGRLAARFGQTRSSTGTAWQGVFVRADEGVPVRAVFHGRVAFADWLRGFGLLLILDHGDGYMSLYSHNQVLYKQVGDWVEAADLIGRVGVSGGLDDPGLYFEIRHNGEPRDPLVWCRAK